MAEVATIHVRVVSSEELVFEGEASSVVAPGWDGMVGILPNHAPMIALLGGGKLSVDRAGGGAEEYQVAGGVLKVEKNQVTILPEKYSGIDSASVGDSLV